jgi:hypothetical protein
MQKFRKACPMKSLIEKLKRIDLTLLNRYIILLMIIIVPVTMFALCLGFLMDILITVSEIKK